MRIENEAAYVLETRPYRETSLLIEAFSAQHGRIALVARGIRGESRRQGARRAALEPFRLLRVGFSGRGEVMSLTAVEPDGSPLRPVGAPLFAGLYVNELVQKLTGRADPAPTLFSRYSMWLAELADLLGAENRQQAAMTEGVPAVAGSARRESHVLSWSLRRFERDLLGLLGYALALDHDSDTGDALDPDDVYALDPEHGARPWSAGSAWPRARGSTLLAWAEDDAPDPGQLRELKRLARQVIRHHIGGAELRAWKLAAEWRLQVTP